VLVNVGLFVSRSIQYRASNGYVIVARACGKFQGLQGYIRESIRVFHFK
jgi:hypothetical protein